MLSILVGFPVVWLLIWYIPIILNLFFLFKKKIQLYNITLNAYYTVTSTNTLHSLQGNWPPVDLQMNNWGLKTV